MKKHPANSVVYLNDSLFRWIGIPVVAVLANFIFYRESCKLYNVSIWKSQLAALIITILIWELNRQILIRVRRYFPDVSQTGKRILYSFIGYFIVSAFIATGSAFVFNATGLWNHVLSGQEVMHDFLLDMLFVLFVGGTYEALYFFRKWKSSFSETQELRKENLQSQLDSLKNQVNPHFLFNSLNTLSSLIDEDKAKAVLFVDELSRVYRYLLQNNDSDLTSLENELQFAKAYFFLLQTRFGEGVKMDLNIGSECYSRNIPPLTLQILIENAVKHNQVSSVKPLRIQVYTDGARNLCVENNLQKKILNVPSNKMGLANISAKYKLLNHPEVVIHESPELFRVVLPLIAN